MLQLVLVTALLLMPPSDCERVEEYEIDTLEVNHLTYATQIIFWDEYSGYCCLHVRRWHWCKEPTALPKYYRRQEYPHQCEWREKDVYKVVRARRLKVTFTTNDPEIDDRKFVPMGDRWGF